MRAESRSRPATRDRSAWTHSQLPTGISTPGTPATPQPSPRRSRPAGRTPTPTCRKASTRKARRVSRRPLCVVSRPPFRHREPRADARGPCRRSMVDARHEHGAFSGAPADGPGDLPPRRRLHRGGRRRRALRPRVLRRGHDGGTARPRRDRPAGSLGPFTFGVSSSVAGKDVKPGAFSMTMIEVRNDEEKQRVRELSRRVGGDMLEMPGFVGFLGAVLARGSTRSRPGRTSTASATCAAAPRIGRP